MLAPDDGVISARDATVGSLTQAGEELFRLIRGGRLEWRAEVPAADLARVAPGGAATLTLPQSGVVLRDGFAYVFRLEGDGEQARVSQAKVATGRRLGERIEIVSGLDPQARVVATGGGFLADGDPVRVVAAAAKWTFRPGRSVTRFPRSSSSSCSRWPASSPSGR